MIKFVSIILSILLVGCISSPPIYKIDDISQYDGSKSIQLIENHLEPGFIGADVEFNAEKFIARDGNVYYSIVLHVFSLNGLFIEEGKSLVLLVDGTRIGFSGDGSEDYRDTWDEIDRVRETAFYDVTSEQLRNIANAKDVSIKIKGAQYSIKREFIPENFANLKRFIAEYVDR